MRNPSASATACCSKVGIKRGPWTPEEDEVLSAYIGREGEGRWRTLPKRAGLHRCGKSCRLRWMNYLRPDVKRGHIAPDEEDLILRLHRLLGNRWSLIAGRIPGRTDNEIKNYWNTHLSKKLINQGIDPRTHKPLMETTTTTTTPPNNSAQVAAPCNNIYNPKPNPNSSQELQEAASSSHQAAKLNPNPNPNPGQLYEYPPAGAMMQGGTKNWVDDDHYMCNEDLTFSSFLDTLMSDQAPGFVAHGHQQPPISLDQVSFWEAELIMRSTMETLAGDMQTGFNTTHHHHHTS